MVKRKKQLTINLTIPIALIILALFVFAVIFFSNISKYHQTGANQGTTSTTSQVLQQLTSQQQCQNNGNIWCNNFCYNQCPTGQRFNCPLSGQPSCIATRSLQDMENSIVYIRHDVTGCCDSNSQISNLLGGSGSGVIIYKDNQTNTIYAITSRHVVDCVFAGTCNYPTSETISIRTQDGNFYTPSAVSYASKNLDIAILQFQSSNSNLIQATLNYENYTIGDSVTAIGYPAFGVQSPQPVLQFSVTNGIINNVYNLLTYQGLSFTAIQSDALTGHGASGGGLFNQDGLLTGIITWGDTKQQITIAIDTKVLLDLIKSNTGFIGSCYGQGYNLLDKNACCKYGTIEGNDGNCYPPCGKPSSYCPSPNVCYNNQCYGQCPSGYIFGSDALCHPQCGSSYCSTGLICYNNQCYAPNCGNSLCPTGSYCYNNQCVTCQSGYYLGTDGRCHPS